MRLSDLLEQDVVDTSGRRWGAVHDALLVQDGPLLPSGYAAYRLHGLLVGRATFGTRLGFVAGRGETRGPWPLKALVRWLHRRAVYVPWPAVREVTDDAVIVDAPPDGFRHPRDAA